MTLSHEVLISILDNDLYKFSMQNAVLKKYKNRDIPVVYQFTNRSKDLRLNSESLKWLQKQINNMEYLKLTKEENEYLSNAKIFPYFDSEYINYLSEFRFRPQEQVKLTFNPVNDTFELEVTGQWHETILYEVPLLALISEAYFRFTDRDWDYKGQIESADKKARALIKHGCYFSEFGTRRRRDFKTQESVIETIHKVQKEYEQNEVSSDPLSIKKGACVGTSNVYLAKKYNMTPIGTVAHEFFMAVSALKDIKSANQEALNIWLDVYKDHLGIALTDTFTTDVFLRQGFTHDLASRYAGVRQDSGNPFEFIDKVVAHYKQLGIDTSTKTIVFSDSLNVERALALHDQAQKANIQCRFGIGTYFTNDFQRASNREEHSKALSIVIKLKECDGKRVVKLSDDPSKHSADAETILAYKKELGIDH